MLYQKLESSLYDSIRVFIGLIDLYEPFLGEHVHRVAALSVTLARHLELSEGDIRTVEMSARLHDIGLLGIPPRLMAKRRAVLPPEEFALIQQAPAMGQEALQSIERLDRVGQIIRAQHERYDGTGFPDGLAGEAIPFEARLLCVTNAYDAMRFKRLEQMSLSVKEIMAHFREQRGKQFDPLILDAFFQVLRQQCSKSRPERAVKLRDLLPGMKLARSVYLEERQLLVARETVLTGVLIEKLRRFHRIYAFADQLAIYTNEA